MISSINVNAINRYENQFSENATQIANSALNNEKNLKEDSVELSNYQDKLTESMVDNMEIESLYSAQLSVIKTQNEMLGSVIDLQA